MSKFKENDFNANEEKIQIASVTSFITDIPDEKEITSEDVALVESKEVVVQKKGCKMKHVGQTWDASSSVDQYANETTTQDKFNICDELDEVKLINHDSTSIIITSSRLTNDPTKFLSRSLPDISSTLFDKRTLQFTIYALGIFCSFIMSGIFSEKLLSGSFGPKSESFSFVCVFVFTQNVVNHIYAEVLLCTVLKNGEDKTDTKYYALASFSNCFSMYLASKSLTWINYPTQVLGKSIKPIPVMIFNVLIGKQRYSFKKYCFVSLVVIGVSVFVLMNKKSGDTNLHINFGWGELCVTVSLICDGITGAVQERMRQDYQTKPGHFMSNLNKWSMLYVGIGMFLSREVVDFYNFMVAFPIARYYLTAIAICSALGQTFIFLMVSHFGSLSCSLVTTSRKFFTILGSIIIFRHSMSPLQWLATFLVFFGLLLDTYFSNKEQRSKNLARSQL